MKRIFTYSLLFFILLTACEDVYEPDIDVVDNVLVADARISADSETNTIHIYESVPYYDNAGTGPGIVSAKVSLSSSSGEEFQLIHSDDGQYKLNRKLNPDEAYKLRIEYGGNVYESEFEEVPKTPSLDFVYGFEESQVREVGGENDVDNFKETKGVQLYADITENEDMPYHRFTARHIVQYTYLVEVDGPFGATSYETMYGWKTTYPAGSFNIASPPEYASSKEIKKHPLFFLPNTMKYEEEHNFAGWIIILSHYGITANAHAYYSDLNKQLDSEGKIFDPLYVQARSNISCTTNPELVILGNFEISKSNETRYFLRYVSESSGFIFRPIEEFYEIPFSGEQLIEIPEFWQFP
ncbi:DUF4249 domain-containing protein [uncultured Draconibacterium sp.]|uniref:DUF4249 domain-containing protein n=1 Tax=uncultured Draconibacterium sp. TaxID=1573823 RepID=UPI0025FB5186|nr:DUF4249 domain-containing protein [uncultured Draconibacterium sp.]